MSVIGGWDERVVTGEKPRKRMPVQKPGKSEQVVCTPPSFLTAVKHKLGIQEFDIDLAADEDNAVCPAYYDEAMNSLSRAWSIGTGWNWCNPPFGHLEPWVTKAAGETSMFRAKTAMLLPASVGSDWWKYHVDDKAHVLFLNGRLTFVGHDSPYPKDLALLLYSYAVRGGYEVWNWRLDA